MAGSLTNENVVVVSMSTPRDRIEAKLGLTGPPLASVRAGPPTIPDHELVRQIGQGAYGEVWLARNALGTWRAVKVVYRDNFKDARPYEREFAGIRRFEPLSRSNEGFVDVLQVGRDEAGGWFYYVMELADAAEPRASDQCSVTSIQSEDSRVPEPTGSALNTEYCSLNTSYVPRTLARDLHQRGRLPLEDCLQLGLTLSLALGHLHRHGLIHRDVKPSNIIFVGGVPKLADIGLVTEAQGANTFVGTEGFIPPEGPTSPQADLYALGKVLYEAAMGKDRNEFPEPFTQISTDRESMALMEFNAVLLRACAPDPKQRYATAEEMHADLALLRSGKSVNRMRTIERRLRFVTRAGAIATGIAALATGLYLWQAKQTKAMRQMAEANEHERKLAEANLYFADIRVAYQDWESGQIAGVLDRLRQHIPQGMAPDHRGWEWYYLLSLCHRDERTLSGHTGGVLAVSCDPTGQRFASGSRDRTVRVWDAETGKSIAELKGHENFVFCVGWSPDGRRLASGGHDGKLVLWDVETRQKLFTLDCDDKVLSLAWSPDGKRIAAGGSGHLPVSKEGLVTIWDATSGRRLHYLTGDVGLVWSLAWQPTGKLLVAGENYNGRMQVWDADQGRLLQTIQAHDHYISSLAWKPDGRQLASASSDQRVKIWNADTWKPAITIGSAHKGYATAVAWSEDGQRLISGGSDGLVKVWDPNTGRLLNTLRGHQQSITSLGWWLGRARILSGSEDGCLKIWSPDPNQVARTLKDGRALEWNPDQRHVALSRWNKTEKQGSLEILDAGNWQTVMVIPEIKSASPDSMAWNPDGCRLAVCFIPEHGGFVRVWDWTTRQPIFALTNTIPDHNGDRGFARAAWSPDGRLLAAAGRDAAVRIWNIATKEHVLSFYGHSSAVVVANWSPDGRWIASKDFFNGEVFVWDAQTGKVRLKLQCAAGADAGSPHCVAWNPRGDRLAAGTVDGTVKVWDAVTGQEIHALIGHTSRVRSVDWSPDGRRLVSGAEDHTVRVWDAEKGSELLVLPYAHDRVPKVAWSPAGRMIAVADDSALIFDATIGYELAPTLAPVRTNR